MLENTKDEKRFSDISWKKGNITLISLYLLMSMPHADELVLKLRFYVLKMNAQARASNICFYVKLCYIT